MADESDRHEPGPFVGLPGADLVEQGLADLRAGTITELALLVLVAEPRLRGLGIDVPPAADIPRPVEHQLFLLLQREYGDGAHSRFNSLRRRIVSFAQALAQRQNRAR